MLLRIIVIRSSIADIPREYSQLKLVSSLPKDANLRKVSITFNMCILIVMLCYMEYRLPKRKEVNKVKKKVLI